jgi:hypothetical protein
MQRVNIFILVLVIVVSCTSPNNKIDSIAVINTNSSNQLESSDSFNTAQVPVYESVDKENVEDGSDYLKHMGYGIKIHKPFGWKKFPAQAEHTILKVGYKKYGAQVSLIRMHDLNANFTDSDLEYSVTSLLKDMSESGITLQNVIKQKTYYKGCLASKINATYILYQGEQSLVEKYIVIQFVRDGILYTISSTYPEMLVQEVGYSIDKIINSIEFD